MKFISLFTVFLASTLWSFGQVKKDFSNLSFNSVEVSGAFTVYLRMGDSSDVTIIADKDIIDRVSAKVEDEVLEIEFEQDWWDWSSNNSSVDVYITLKTVKNLSFNGACEVKGKNTLRGTTITIETSGACKMEAQWACSTLAVEMSGASKATFSGTCRKVNIEASGACAFYAAHLQTENMSIDAAGASKAEVWATRTLRVEASGACKVAYKGDPEITKEVAGASSIEKL